MTFERRAQAAGGGPSAPAPAAACERCLRRSWLLALLSARLEYRSRGEGRLIELLALPDEELLQAVGGRRRSELYARYARFDPAVLRIPGGVQTVCRHDRRYPNALADDAAPRMLHVACELDTFCELEAGAVVAIVGASSASDYGREMARSLARGLGASGVTVIAALTDGVAAAAHEGALDAAASSIAVLGGGVDAAFPARRRALYERVRHSGCLVAELPCGLKSRLWALRAAERIVAGLAALTIVVEADESARDLAGARMAQALAKPIAAVPGRVTSPLSRGTNALLIEGANLVTGPQDVLDLLCGPAAEASVHRYPANGLPARLRRVLERVGAGLDTPDQLTAASDSDAGETLLALAELELRGLLARGDGGRYLPRQSISGR